MRLHSYFVCILVIILVSFVVRFAFFNAYPTVGIFPDSRSYYQTAVSMSATGIYSDPWRTPIYPLILILIESITGNKEIGYFITPGDLSYNIITIQSLFGILSAVFLFILLEKITQHRIIAVSVSIFYSLNPLVISFEQMILTESISLFWMLMFIALALSLLKNIKLLPFLFFLLFSCIGVFLKPSILFLPALTMLYIVIMKRTKILIMYSVTFFCIYILTIGFYIQSNTKHFSYSGITRVSEVNVLGKILQFNLPITNVSSTNPWKKPIEEYRNQKREADPWRFLEVYPELTSIDATKQFRSISSTVLISSLPKFLYGNAALFAVSLVDRGETIQTFLRALNHPGIHRWLEFYFSTWYLRLFILIGSLLLLLGKSSYKQQQFYITCTVLFFTYLTVSLTYDDYGRHLLILEPLFYLLLGMLAHNSRKKLNTLKNRVVSKH